MSVSVGGGGWSSCSDCSAWQSTMVSMMVGGRESAEGDTERQEGERGIVNVLEREKQ